MTLASPYRIGVDVGGTNTDSVILDVRATNELNRGVIALHKTPTTSPNVTDGIETAVLSVLEQSKVPRDQIACLIIGTTHFINAIVEHDARRLSKVAILRLSKSFTREVPPFSDFPPALTSIMNGHYAYVDGGLSIDGSPEAAINEAQVVKECETVREKGLDAVVISGVFSPIDNHFHQEDEVRKIVRRELPDVDIVCSSEVSQIGFLERENASILNASILKFARRTIRGFKSAMKRLKLSCDLYLTQNDGTLIDAPSAARLPIRTFSSGPTNSMRGAAYLGLHGSDKAESERTATIVVDIGGTSSDIGVLLPSGFPRQASAYVEVAGVKINFSMPHVESIGLGGGSIVRGEGAKTTIGPDSVGHYLSTKGTVFGGDTLTATDIAVAAGAEIGNPELVKDLDKGRVSAAQAKIKSLLEGVIDQMKTSPAPLPVLLVGGGSILASTELEGVSKVIFPPFHSVANAVGAAMSKVGGTVDSIQSTAEKAVSQVIEEAKATAIEKAVASGAIRETVFLAEVDAIPLQYVANQVRVIVRAVGELSPGGVPTVNGMQAGEDDEEGDDEIYNEAPKQDIQTNGLRTDKIDVATYRPKVVKNPDTGIQEWIVSETDLVWLADGCYVLGCAGGGSPFSEYIRIRDQLRQGHIIRIIDPYSVKKDAVLYWGGRMGSPAVAVERLANNETEQAVRDLMEYLHHDSFDAIMGVEIGGSNGLQPLALGSSKNNDRPVVDADWMGRAYPTYWQTTICVYQPGQLAPCSIVSGDGNTIIMTKSATDEIVDRSLRASCIEMGSSVGMAACPTTGDKMLNYSVLNTLSLAWRIGRCIARADADNTLSTVAEQMVDEVGGPESGKILFRGKIVAVERRLYKGHSYGEITIQQIQKSELESDGANRCSEGASRSSIPVATGGVLKIPFKNENIYAKHISEQGEEKYVAMVPDLICVLDTQSGKALGVPEFRYGVMVTVLGIACSPRWTDTERGLEIGGPGAFGYHDLEYVPLGKYVQPKSVVKEYAEE
ncbi:hydantoinase [Arthroderma uncinatum]|uniref:hydantoinase n=1 Tax=Arthroderma uncinatum TaxID=74035 RepID=UPI00144ADB41|nr:hydantoinase [Arthroderma uncinatum]KAF3490740.1 hydantoinase [Arthroderma uncinatum]